MKPFKAEIPQSILDDLKRRIEDTPEIRDTYENLDRAEKNGEDLGVKKEWMTEAIREWKAGFDWYVTRPNSPTQLREVSSGDVGVNTKRE